MMNIIKTYEGFFDFKSKLTEDDEIALSFMKRLKKVKGISPYSITYTPGDRTNSYQIDKYEVNFDDTPIKLWSVVSTNVTSGFDEQSQEALLNKGLSKINNSEFYAFIIFCEGEQEKCKANGKIIKELFDLVKSVYENDKEARRIEHIKVNMNDQADLIDESIHEREVVFTNKRNPRLKIIVTKSPDGRIVNIENGTGMRFPFSVGQILNRTAEVWACNNNFLMDGKDTCPEKKIFGVRAKDVPQGHEWRHIFPHKFK